MTRTLPDKNLLVASHNKGKIRELEFLFEGYDLAMVTAGELGLPEPEETGTTFVENARIKALAAAKASGRVALADDSGLCVEALGGAPGVYTADWAGVPRDWDRAMRLVEEELHKVGAVAPEQRKAKFVSLLCLAWPDGHTQEYLGEVNGTLVWPPRRGPIAYGYDPVFMPEGETRTFGEMTAEEKHGSIKGTPRSHRARSAALFAADVLDPADGR
ncbi:non-canonical purine NTP pyrophosphatase [Chthonobacter albigriseus]|uniref:non-canonical purine NTP pyrophosphatase n=1 Tax=Chthonobacter albigriseus TaxID=1683161 RepID=UPI0015EEAC16|nr:non-canonical purine NTP pyrophosphatase [Chthonobacter albigriseus]